MLLALAAAPTLAGAVERMELGTLPWRVAGKAGFTVDAAAFPDTSGDVVEVYVRIPPATIAALARDEQGEGSLKLEVRMRPGTGRTAPVVQEIPFGAADSSAGFGKVVIVRVAARPGTHRLFVQLTDERSHKRGLAYIGRKVAESAEVEGPIVVPKAEQSRRLSSIEFVWEDSLSRREGPFHHGGRTLIPNPERLYGKYADRLKAFFVARGAPGDARPWRWIARILGPGGDPVWEQQGQGPAGEWLHANCQIDIDWPAGGYDMSVEAWQEGDASRLSRSARFGVAWLPDAWFRNAREVEDRVHFLLSPEGAERFAALNPGEQERFLDDFWGRRDPTPGTPANEARDTFDERVRIANLRYSRSGIGAGMFSDMGRVYIRYGEPSEIHDQVIPTGDDTVSQILADIAATDDRALGDIHQKGLGGDQRPFAVWIYEGDIPLPPDIEPDDARHIRRRRLLFLFVDERGIGDYRMRYGTE